MTLLDRIFGKAFYGKKLKQLKMIGTDWKRLDTIANDRFYPKMVGYDRK